ncbi:MAG: DUF1573 domain-containing protein [Bacteroidales bacterium]|nr:DUF1573 domain-containing protein [Bacteroidales bacterium]
MKKYIIISFILYVALLLMFPFVCVLGAEKNETSTEDRPVISVNKNYHDFGQIAEGGNGEVVFEIENKGGGLLIIESVKTSCGCLIVDYSSRGLMKNEKGYIKVRYNTNIVGEIMRSVVINSNDENNPKIVLRLVGEVVKSKTE